MTLSVVIPAHDEERVIGRALTSMLTGLADGVAGDASTAGDFDAEIIVVCNGCDDKTAEIARSFGPPVVVIDAPVASKAGALNAGDEVARHFPRCYVDADVEVTGYALRAVAAALAREAGPLAAAPRLRVDLTGCSWPIRAYYRVWTATPYVTDGLIGSGFYGLSEAGRARFDRFPAIIADDLFIYRQFDASERESLAEVSFTVHPPRRLRHLLRVQTRRRAGIAEYRARFGADGDAAGGDGGAGAGAPEQRPWSSLADQARRVRAWPALAVYLWVVLDGRARGQWKARFGDLGVWEREDSSRVNAPLPFHPEAADRGGPTPAPQQRGLP